MTSFRLLKRRSKGSSKGERNQNNVSNTVGSNSKNSIRHLHSNDNSCNTDSNRSLKGTSSTLGANNNNNEEEEAKAYPLPHNNILSSNHSHNKSIQSQADSNYHHDPNNKKKKKSISQRFSITSPSRRKDSSNKQVPTVVSLKNDPDGNIVPTMPLSPMYSNSSVSSTPERPTTTINQFMYGNQHQRINDDRIAGFTDDDDDSDDGFDLPPSPYYTSNNYNISSNDTNGSTCSNSITSSITNDAVEEEEDLFLKLQTERYNNNKQDNIFLNKNQRKKSPNKSENDNQSQKEQEEQGQENSLEFNYEETLKQIKDIESKQTSRTTATPLSSESYQGLEESNIPAPNDELLLLAKKKGGGLSSDLEQLPPLAPTRAALIQNRNRQAAQDNVAVVPSSHKFRTLSQTLQGMSTVHDVLENGSYADSNDDDESFRSFSSLGDSSVHNQNNKTEQGSAGESVIGISKPNYTMYNSLDNDDENNEEASNGRIGIHQPLYHDPTPSFILANQKEQGFNIPTIPPPNNPPSNDIKSNKSENTMDNAIDINDRIPECERVAQRLASSEMKWKFSFLLLIQPNDKIFELIRVPYPPDKTTVGDLLNHLLPVASSTPTFSQQSHIGICRPYSSSANTARTDTNTAVKTTNDSVVVWDLDKLLQSCCDNNNVEVNTSKRKRINVWIAIPDGQTAKDCQLLGRVILKQNPKMVQLIKASSRPRKNKGKQLICDLQEETMLLSKKQRKLLKKIASSNEKKTNGKSINEQDTALNEMNDSKVMTTHEIQVQAMKLAKETYLKSISQFCKENRIDRNEEKRLSSSFPDVANSGNNNTLSKTEKKVTKVDTDGAIFLTPMKGPSLDDDIDIKNCYRHKKDVCDSFYSYSKAVLSETEDLLIEESLEKVIQTCMECVRGYSIMDRSHDLVIHQIENNSGRDDENVRHGFEIMSIVSLLILTSRLLTSIEDSIPKFTSSGNEKEFNSDQQDKKDLQIQPSFDISTSLSRLSIKPPVSAMDDGKDSKTLDHSDTFQTGQMGNDRNNFNLSLQILPLGILTFIQAGTALFLLIFQGQNRKNNGIQKNNQKIDLPTSHGQKSSERIEKLQKARDTEWTPDICRRRKLKPRIDS